MAGLLDYLEGIGETGATLGTGLLSGVVGAPYGLFKGITSGRYGSPEAVRIAEEEAKKFMERNTYVPRGKVAQEALQKAAQLFKCCTSSACPECTTRLLAKPSAKSEHAW